MIEVDLEFERAEFYRRNGITPEPEPEKSEPEPPPSRPCIRCEKPIPPERAKYKRAIFCCWTCYRGR